MIPEQSPCARRPRSTPVAILAVALALLVTLAGVPALSPAQAAPIDPGRSLPGALVPIFLGPDLATPPAVVPRQPVRPGAAAAQFIVNYDAGFMANAEARAAFQRGVDIWAAQLTSTVPIVVNARFAQFADQRLGQAGPISVQVNFTNAPQRNTIYSVALANKLAGADLDPDQGDIAAEFSSSYANWYFGGDTTPADKTNFTSVVLHELGHGLGFAGSARNENGTGSWGVGGDPPTPIIYDRFIVNGNGQAILNTALFPNPSVALGSQLTSNALFFNGPNARAANGGTSPQIEAPLGWSASSYSHLDEEAYPAGNPNALMTPIIQRGETIYAVSLMTLGIFADMGWTANAPSPSPTPGGQRFLDVPPGAFGYDQINQLAARGITTGCDASNFCPTRDVTRAEMAAFIIRAITTQTAAPAGPATPTFADVPASHPQYGFIEALVARGITTGCGDPNARPREYCPDGKVTRAEMAAFLIRAKTNQTAAPAGPATPTFSDVPASHPQYGFIEALVGLGITTGCGDPNARPREYCPGQPVLREQMAVFIIRAYP